MKEAQFYWGPFARGCYIAAWWFCPFFVWTNPKVLVYYFPALIFIGLGLRPLLERTNLYNLFQALLIKKEDASWSKINKQRRREVEQQERSKTLKQQRIQDPRLPKNW